MNNIIDLKKYKAAQPGRKEREWLDNKLPPEDFAERMQRIRNSLEKINQTMWELHGGRDG